MSRADRLGTVYLLHFDPPLRHAQHYLGWCVGDPLDRVQEHLDGEGARIVAAAVARGIHVELVRVWEGVDRHFERKIKRRGSLKQVCPCCRKADLARRAAGNRRRRAQKRAASAAEA